MLNSRFYKRVWAGLGVLAVVLLLAGPRLGWVAVLPALACCVPMVFMMRGESLGRAGAARPPGAGHTAWITRRRRGIERLIKNAFR